MIWLRLQNLAKSFGQNSVLEGLSLAVEQGTVVSVCGANGSGKSTLLRIAAGLLRPSSGTVECGEGDNAPWDAAHRREKLGYLSPELSLYQALSARENLEFFARVRGFGSPAEELLEFVGLRDRGDEPILSFSSGMKQRLKLAYALQTEPKILLLDEPGVTLDESGRELIPRVLERQRERGLALLATNDPEEVALGDDVLRLGD